MLDKKIKKKLVISLSVATETPEYQDWKQFLCMWRQIEIKSFQNSDLGLTCQEINVSRFDISGVLDGAHRVCLSVCLIHDPKEITEVFCLKYWEMCYDTSQNWNWSGFFLFSLSRSLVIVVWIRCLSCSSCVLTFFFFLRLQGTEQIYIEKISSRFHVTVKDNK
jgi:hypothetical protein